MRYAIVHDDDGHQYLIEAEEEDMFDEWMNLDAYSEDEDIMQTWNSLYEHFDDKRFYGGTLTFTDPELDGKKMA